MHCSWLALSAFTHLPFPRAQVSEGPYKHAWTPPEALLEICAGAGNHFDPRVVEGFAKMLERPYSLQLQALLEHQPPNSVH